MRFAEALLGILIIVAGASDSGAQTQPRPTGRASAVTPQFRAALPPPARALSGPRSPFASLPPRRSFHSSRLSHQRLLGGSLLPPYSYGCFSNAYSSLLYAYASPFSDGYRRMADYFPYLYFYDRYDQEALRTREAADRYDAEFRREEYGGTVKSPDHSASDPSGLRTDAPLSPHQVLITLNGEPRPRAANGAPVVLGSGRHTLRISAVEPAAISTSD